MMPHRVRMLIAKELRQLLRDPVSMGLCLLMPLVMLFLFAYAVNLDVEDVSLGVYDADRTPASRALQHRLTATAYFELKRQFDDTARFESALQAGEIRLAMAIPLGFHERLLRGERTPVQVIADGTYPATASLAAAYASAIVRAFPEVDAGAIEVETRIWYNPSLRSINYVVPGLFAVILMAFPPLLTALAIVREKETGTIQQIYASPITSAEFIAGKLVPFGAVAFLQMTMVVLTGYFWFAVPFRGSAALFLGVALIYVMTTVSIGLLVSTVTRTQLAAMLLALIVTLMPSFLFSGFLFPIFTMPVTLQLYSQLFPAGYFMEISRGIVLKGSDIAAVWPQILLLAGYTLAVFAIASWRLKQKVA